MDEEQVISSNDEQESNLPVEKKEFNLQEPKIEDPTNIEIPVPKFNLNDEQTFEDQAKDYVMAAATVAAVKDEETQKAVLENKSEEVILHSEVKKKKERVEERKAEKQLQDAQREVHDGIATKAGITATLPGWMQKILYPAIGTIQCILYLVIGTIGSLFTILLDVVNMIADKFAKLTDSAKKIFWSVFWIFIVLLAFYVLAIVLERWDIFILPWKWKK